MFPEVNVQTRPQPNNHKLYIDVLTAISCIGVVFIHANGIFWSRPSGSVWVTANIIETVFYYAVPIFFMISGATLIDYSKRYGTKVYIQKRIKRAGIPFVAWSIIAWVVLYIAHKLPENAQSLGGGFIERCELFSFFYLLVFHSSIRLLFFNSCSKQSYK